MKSVIDIGIALFSIVGVACFLVILFDIASTAMEKNMLSIRKDDAGLHEHTQVLLKQSEAKNEERRSEVDRLKKKMNVKDETLSEMRFLSSQEPFVEEVEVKKKKSNYFHKRSLGYEETIDLIFNKMYKEYLSNDEDLILQAIEDYDYARKRAEIRCVLPYVFILKVLDTYTQEENQGLKDAFDEFNVYASSSGAKRILRNRFLSNEEKFHLINKETDILKENESFAELLYYILGNYSYKHLRNIYRNFAKCFNHRYEKGTATITCSSQEEVEHFKAHWNYALKQITVVYEIDRSMLGGIQIRSGSALIDYSLREITTKYVRSVEKGLTYGKEN